MSLNFPDSPTVGDIFSPIGAAASYQWDGTLWRVVGQGDVKVKSGWLPFQRDVISNAAIYTGPTLDPDTYDYRFRYYEFYPSVADQALDMQMQRVTDDVWEAGFSTGVGAQAGAPQAFNSGTNMFIGTQQGAVPGSFIGAYGGAEFFNLDNGARFSNAEVTWNNQRNNADLIAYRGNVTAQSQVKHKAVRLFYSPGPANILEGVVEWERRLKSEFA